jgi:hypothetical protein
LDIAVEELYSSPLVSKQPEVVVTLKIPLSGQRFWRQFVTQEHYLSSPTHQPAFWLSWLKEDALPNPTKPHACPEVVGWRKPHVPFSDDLAVKSGM